jgi:arylsulfatase A-like enzyme
VSATRLFHTVIEAAGLEAYVDGGSQSLTEEMQKPSPSPLPVFCEAYAPEFALKAMETHKPHLIERLNCHRDHRAVYEGPYKLMCIDDEHAELFSLDVDPSEKHSLETPTAAGRIQRMRARLSAFLQRANARRPKIREQQARNLDDRIVQQRLRDLGYLE